VRWRVISAVLVLGAFSLAVPAQIGHAPKKNKGPRALGLIELAPNGKAHLIPITIQVDGKYYDAGAYKAAPVPMALWSETVYEGVLTGVSQGLFTVTGALQRKDESGATEWMAEGSWQSASSLKARSVKKPVSSVPRGMNDDEGPPVLRRAGSEKPKPPEPTSVPAPASPASSTGTAPPPPQPPASAAPPPTTSSQQEQSQTDKPPEDSDRPTLKRGQPGAVSAAEAQKKTVPSPPAATTASTPKASSTSVSTSPASSGTQPGAASASPVQLIPAISDAHSPELLNYAYNMKPEEEQEFRKRMLAIAADELRTHAGQSASGAGNTPAGHASSRSKPASGKFVQPDFEDAQLRVFDLSNTNEPELILTAKARMPQHAHEKTSSSDVQYMITLVAREDVNGDFHKALVNITDTQHLDAIPRLELIDAVDVDGDGRGELLFRQVTDGGSAFVVYSVIGDRLYPLFQGSPG
jgi:outer membrane biosynthesis protein TonB